LTNGTANVFINSSIYPTNGRAKTGSPSSKYKLIPTENIKFEKFMELIFKSKMKAEDIKEEIMKYV